MSPPPISDGSIFEDTVSDEGIGIIDASRNVDDGTGAIRNNDATEDGHPLGSASESLCTTVHMKDSAYVSAYLIHKEGEEEDTPVPIYDSEGYSLKE